MLLFLEQDYVTIKETAAIILTTEIKRDISTFDQLLDLLGLVR